MTPTMVAYTGLGQTLPVALKTFANTVPDAGAVALLYAPTKCLVLKFSNLGKLTDSKGRSANGAALASVYEARVFHENAEVRWRNDPASNAQHRTVVLSQKTCDIGLSVMPWDAPIIGTLRQTYLLWGTGVHVQSGLTSGWSRLATPRIGKLDVPIGGVKAEQRVLLRVVEYLAEYEDGNVAIAEERLLGLEVDRG